MRLNAGALLVAGLVLAMAATLGWQRVSVEAQRVELERLLAEQRELIQLRAEHTRLVAQQLAPAEQEKWRADHTAATTLRAEVDALRRTLDDAKQTAAEKRAAKERFPVGATVPAKEWKNAGGANPAAALETVLWAAAGGDVGVFAQRLRIFDGTHAAARALLESLPATLRTHVRTPEEAIAFLSIKDVPLGSARVREWSESSGPSQQVTLQLTQQDGTSKESNLLFHRFEGDWKLVVTDAVVARYAALVKASASGP